MLEVYSILPSIKKRDMFTYFTFYFKKSIHKLSYISINATKSLILNTDIRDFIDVNQLDLL